MSVTVLPGTTIEQGATSFLNVKNLLDSLFLAGGLSLSQVSYLTGLPPHTIQNWVKRGFVSPPIEKKYTQSQFCRIAMIHMLKDSLQLEQIFLLTQYINGAQKEDGEMDDSKLYLLFMNAVFHTNQEAVGEVQTIESCCKELVNNMADSSPLLKKRLQAVLTIMLIAYSSAQLKRKAERKLDALLV